jgi:hypothetical protein
MYNESTIEISELSTIDLHCGSGELDLSQNFLEESSGALELLTLFVEHPKYSKDRPNKVEPVKVDLSHNGNLAWSFFPDVFSGWSLVFRESRMLAALLLVEQPMVISPWFGIDLNFNFA